MLTLNIETIVIFLILAFAIGLAIGVAIAPRHIGSDINKRLPGDTSTEAPKPSKKKNKK